MSFEPFCLSKLNVNSVPIRSLLFFAIGVALLLTVLETRTRIGAINSASHSDYVVTNPPDIDASSPSGYEVGKRQLILASRSDDLHWIMNTQERISRDSLRVRNVHYDNAPYGRPSHWSSLHSWWIGLAARIEHTFTGNPIGVSVEKAALYSNAVLIGIAFVVLTLLAAYRMGALACCALILGFLGLIPWRSMFLGGNADHHAGAALCSAMAVFFLLLSMWEAPRDSETSAAQRSASRFVWWVLSGVAGGMGLWINAVSQAPLLAGILCGGVAGIWISRQRTGETSVLSQSKAWRIWGISGCLTSLIAYLIEYAPNHFEMRLEVNHPLYALVFLGIGEVLSIFSDFATRSDFEERPRLFVARAAIAVATIIPLPLMILFAREDVFRVADPFLLSLHNAYILEFQPLFQNLKYLGSASRQASLLSPALLIVFFILLLVSKDMLRAKKEMMAISLMPTVIAFAFALFQTRWWGHSYALLWIALVPLFLPTGQKRRLFESLAQWAAIAVLLPGLGATATFAFQETHVSDGSIRRMAERGIAHRLRDRMGNSDAVILSGPKTTTALAYFGSMQGLGTLYWENGEGLKRAARIFAAATMEEAYALIQEAEVTHLVFVSWDGFEKEYLKLYETAALAEEVSDNPFLFQLLRDRSIPAWLRLLPMPLPVHEALENQYALVFEVVEPQTSSDALADTAEYYLEMNWIHRLDELEAELTSDPEHLRCLIALARYRFVAGNKEDFRNLSKRILRLSAGGKSLRIEDRIRLAALFAATGERGAARQQVIKLHSLIDEESIRKLSAVSLAQFLQFEKQLGVVFKDAALKSVAEGLLPPYMQTGG